MDIETKEVIARAELPKLFRAMRVALGLSQEKMSELSGISRVQISYYETADSVPTMATFNKWLSAVTSKIKELRKDEAKYIRAFLSKLPESQEERDKQYRFLEKAGIMRQIFCDDEIWIRRHERTESQK